MKKSRSLAGVEFVGGETWLDESNEANRSNASDDGAGADDVGQGAGSALNGWKQSRNDV